MLFTIIIRQPPPNCSTFPKWGGRGKGGAYYPLLSVKALTYANAPDGRTTIDTAIDSANVSAMHCSCARASIAA
jgi:hypothetical protein